MSKAVFSLEPALELELEISETRFGLLPEDLFQLAVRQNTQRAFLFVSKVHNGTYLYQLHRPTRTQSLIDISANIATGRFSFVLALSSLLLLQ